MIRIISIVEPLVPTRIDIGLQVIAPLFSLQKLVNGQAIIAIGKAIVGVELLEQGVALLIHGHAVLDSAWLAINGLLVGGDAFLEHVHLGVFVPGLVIVLRPTTTAEEKCYSKKWDQFFHTNSLQLH